jgi:hypothetical protein
MARHESDREDLIREAVALTTRAEIMFDGNEEAVTIGFRSNNAMSIFVGQDPVYQFDPEGALRRAYVGGFLYRSQHETLARMQRVRTETETILSRTDLTGDERNEFQSKMRSCIQRLLSAVQEERFRVVRSVPESFGWHEVLRAELERVLNAAPWLSSKINAR